MDVRHEHTKIHLGKLQQIFISCFWLGFQFFLSSVTMFILPVAISKMTIPEYKGLALGGTLAIGAVVHMVSSPLFGAYSDSYQGFLKKRFGKRIPFIIFGTVGLSVSLFVLAGCTFAPFFAAIVSAFAIVMLFASMAQAPYSAIIPDVVLREQSGLASGWMGVMTMLGNAIGASIGFYYESIGPFVTMAIIIIVLMVSMGLTSLAMFNIIDIDILGDDQEYSLVGDQRNAIRDGELVEAPTNCAGCIACCGVLRNAAAAFRRPFSSPDFAYLFLSRFLFGYGIFTVQQFMFYYIQDVVPKPYALDFLGKTLTMPNDEAALGLFLIILLVTATISSFVGGLLSDKINKKYIITFSALVQALAVVIAMIPIFHRFDLMLVMAGVFGIGYGCFQSVDWALAIQVLPSSAEFGKDMAIWQLSWVIPQVIAPIVSGSMLYLINVTQAGREYRPLSYTIIFSLSTLCFLVSLFCIYKINLNSSAKLPLDTFFISSDEQQASSNDEIDISDESEELNYPKLTINTTSSSAGNSVLIDDYVQGKLNLEDLSFESSED